MDDDVFILHSKDEPRIEPGRLYGSLDFYYSVITCDECGNWQRLAAYEDFVARQDSDKRGWKIVEGRDLCPVCLSAKLPQSVDDAVTPID
jgi:hypothetical protein